jgi:chemotaxis methyl-accepting protein methylase
MTDDQFRQENLTLELINKTILDISSHLDESSRYTIELMEMLSKSSSVGDFLLQLENPKAVQEFIQNSSMASNGSRGRAWVSSEIWNQMTWYEKIYSNLITGETRFLWSWEPYTNYNYLGEVLRKLPAPKTILSAPCGTGKEVFSIAICSLINKQNVSISGIDKQSSFIENAKAGKITFNVKDFFPEETLQYFHSSKTGDLSISDDVSKICQFYAGDILEGKLPEGEFSLVTCRNFLGYFRNENLEKAITNIISKVKENGILLLDPFVLNFSETKIVPEILSECGFKRIFDDANYFVKQP